MSAKRAPHMSGVGLLIALGASQTGCKETSISEVAVEVARIDVSATSISVEAGSTTSITATPRSPGGSSMTARSITFTSSDPAVAEVTSSGQTGQVRGIRPGTATITARSGAATGTVTATVTARPRIGLSRTTVRLDGVTLGPNPPPQTVQITNAGEGSLAGLTVQSIQYTGGTQGWLAAAIDRSTPPATVTLQATSGSLPVGTYNATVLIGSSTADNSPATIAVELVTACPHASLPAGANVIACYTTTLTPRSWQGFHLGQSFAQPPGTPTGDERTRLNHAYVLASPAGFVRWGPSDPPAPTGQETTNVHAFQAEFDGTFWIDVLRLYSVASAPQSIALVIYY